MRVALAQIQSLIGDVDANIARHLVFVDRAAGAGADLVVFPELSLTGYAPSRAGDLAFALADGRLARLQEASDSQDIALAVGLPVRAGSGVAIGLVLMRPHRPRALNAKHFLHADEAPFFVPGPNLPVVPLGDARIGFAICYELSVPAHAQSRAKAGATLYLATVAKSAAGVRSSYKRLASLAAQHSIPVLFVNAVGPAEGFDNAGGTAVWDRHGRCLAHLTPLDEALLLYDTQSTIQKRLIRHTNI